jgi:hypothetical protein
VVWPAEPGDARVPDALAIVVAMTADQDAGIKLSSVASELLGKSGRAILDALVAGTTDPVVLSELAKGHLRKKIPALREALTASFTGHHAIIVGEILSKLDYLDEAIDRLSVEIV